MDEKAPSSFSYGSASGFVFSVMFAVAIPTTCFAFGGRWLDERLGTQFLFTLLGLLASVVLSVFVVLRLAQRYKSRT